MTGDPTVVWSSDDQEPPDMLRNRGPDATFPAAGQPNLFEELEQEWLKAHKVRKVYSQQWGQETGDQHRRYDRHQSSAARSCQSDERLGSRIRSKNGLQRSPKIMACATPKPSEWSHWSVMNNGRRKGRRTGG